MRAGSAAQEWIDGRTSTSFSTTSTGSLLRRILLPSSEPELEVAFAFARHAGAGWVAGLPSTRCLWEWYVLMPWRGLCVCIADSD